MRWSYCFTRMISIHLHIYIYYIWDKEDRQSPGQKKKRKKKKNGLGCWTQINSTNFTPRTHKNVLPYIQTVYAFYTHTHTHFSSARAWSRSNFLITFSPLEFIAHSWTPSDNVPLSACVFVIHRRVCLANKLHAPFACVRRRVCTRPTLSWGYTQEESTTENMVDKWLNIGGHDVALVLFQREKKKINDECRAAGCCSGCRLRAIVTPDKHFRVTA